MNKITISFIIVFPLITFANTVKKNNESGLSLLKELGNKEKDLADNYVQGVVKNNKNYTSAEIESLKVKVSDIVKSKTFLGSIPKGAILIKIEDGSQIYTTKEIIVSAYRKHDYFGYFFLKNKDGTISFKVHKDKIAKVDDIINMHEKPLFYQPINREDHKDYFDSKFNGKTYFSFEMGLSNSEFTKDLTDKKNVNELIRRYNITTFFDFDFFLELGLNLGLENAQTPFNDFNIHTTTIYLGPEIKTRNFNLFSESTQLSFKLATSLFSEFTEVLPNKDNTFKMAKHIFSISIQEEKTLSFGKLIFGLGLQRDWIQAKADKTALSLNSISKTNDSLSILIGIGDLW